ncbi:putative plasmid replication-associated protein [Staphylococcus aureus]|nr:putative plasmid replication-associated protein [Staphylococcus aureus]
MAGFLDNIKVVGQQKRGFLDDIDTSAVKYTENYKPMAKSSTMRVDTLIKRRLSPNGVRQRHVHKGNIR